MALSGSGRHSARCGRSASSAAGAQTANVLNKLPKSQHAKAKRALQGIWMAETKAEAEAAFDAFVETYAQYEKAAECLKKDREALLAFYDFPAEHWKRFENDRNPIESTFATVRHRTIRSKGCLSNKTALAMVFKLVEGAQKSWRRLDGHNQLLKIIEGVKFIDGLEVAANRQILSPKPPPPDPSGRHRKSAIAPSELISYWLDPASPGYNKRHRDLVAYAPEPSEAHE